MTQCLYAGLLLSAMAAASAQSQSAYIDAQYAQQVLACDKKKPTPIADPKVVAVVTLLQSPLKLDGTTGLVVAPTVADMQYAIAHIPSCVTVTPKLVPPAASGVPSEATILIGLTDFLIARARDELIEAYLTDLKETLAKKNSLLLNLLPKTAVALGQLDAVSTSALVPTLRAAVIADLDGLPLVIFDAKTYPDGTLPLASVPVFQAANQAVKLYYALRRGTAPMTAIGQWATLKSSDISDDALRLLLRLIGTIAAECSTNSTSLAAFVVQDTSNAKWFIAFLTNDLASLEPKTSALQTRMQWVVTSGTVAVVSVVQAYASLESTIKDLRGVVGKSAAPVTSQGGPNDIDAAANTLGIIIQMLDDKASPAVVARATQLVTQISDVVQAVVAKDYPRAMILSITVAQTSLTDSKYAGELRFLNFAAAFAAAKTPADIERVMESVADPVGSYRAKRGLQPDHRRPHQITVNAYLGGTFGLEVGAGHNAPSGAATQAGLTAPLGVEWSEGLGGTFTSFSILGSIIDLGNVANYRLNSSSSAQPKIGFSQVLAPGMFFVWGVTRDVPLSFGVGEQFVPLLRNTTKRSSFNVFRTSVMFAVDVPIIRL